MIRILLLCLFCVGLHAQKITIEDLSFQNEFEKEQIQNFRENPNFLAVLIASSGRGNKEVLKKAEAKLDEVYLALNPEKLQKKSPKKQIKKIFKGVQNDLLVRYNLENQFIEVFENGRYNCVSSTAIYALLLERFNIKYIISQEPEHVYLTATFNELNIVIEGTDPQGGFVPLTDKLIEAQINSLLNRKLITIEELNSPDAAKILEDLFPSKEIDLEELIGVQYENKMAYSYESENYKAAYENALKALYFYDCERFRTGLYFSAYSYLESLDYDDENYVKVLGKLEKLDSSKVHLAEVMRLSDMAMASLQQDNKTHELNKVYHSLKKEFKDSSTLKNVEVIHSILQSELFNNLGRVDSAYFFARKAMRLDSANFHAPQLLVSALFKKASINGFESIADTLEFYYLKYEVLRKNDVFVSQLIRICLAQAHDEIIGKNYSKCKDLLAKFEGLSAKHQHLAVDTKFVGNAYSRLALYEFNQNKSRALKTIKRGLVYAPKNRDLLNIQNMMRN